MMRAVRTRVTMTALPRSAYFALPLGGGNFDSCLLSEMKRALDATMDPDGVWTVYKEGGRVVQTCTRYAGRLIEALADLGTPACVKPPIHR